MEHDKMIVTMEDGLRIVFFKENDNLKFVMCNGGCFNENEVREGSIHAVIGEPLTFTYYYGYGSSEEAKTGTPVKEIEYE